MQTISLEQSVAMIPDGASLMVGGFLAVGTPERVIDEIVRQNKRDLTVIANDTATPEKGIGKLVRAKLLRKAIVSHIGLNPETQRQMMAGELEVELVPQGTLIERIRAGGFGLGGILTQTGIGTPVERSSASRSTARPSPETGLRAGALVQAFLADHLATSAAPHARNQSGDRGLTVIASADRSFRRRDLADHVVTPAPVVDYLIVNRDADEPQPSRPSDREGTLARHLVNLGIDTTLVTATCRKNAGLLQSRTG